MPPRNAVSDAPARTVPAPVASATRRNANAAATAAAAAPAARSKTIAHAAREAGVHVETIRYYERLGLIPRPAPRGAYRQYPSVTIDRIRSIKRAQDFGFSLREIQELFHMTAEGDSSCLAICAKVEQKVREIEERIASLQALRDELRGLMKKSTKVGPATNCQVLQEIRRRKTN